MKNNKSKIVQLGILMSCSVLFLLPFMADNAAHAGLINCPDDVDMAKYPACQFEDKWNESEKFNQLVVLIVSENGAENMTDLLRTFADARKQVNHEYPGLFEQGEQMKNEIYSFLRSHQI